jgi:tRNA dimethylallyltransferase
MNPSLRLAILGPTASGKSALAVEIARRIGGTVINGDPFQAFEGLAIGTGQPNRAEQGGVPHLGYGELPLSASVNPADFGARVRQSLSTTLNPVLVTGSGLYLRGIWDQLSELPPVPESQVQRVRAWAELLGPAMLHRYLAVVDPIRAAQLHPNDRSRIQRALALHLATGERPSRMMDGVKRGVPEGWMALLVRPSRERQRERVAHRVAAMIASGWQEEVQRAIAAGHEADLRRLRPLGYDAWLAGGDPRAIAAGIVQATQAYAKRQITFFRNQWPEIPEWDPDQDGLEVALERLGVR